MGLCMILTAIAEKHICNRGKLEYRHECVAVFGIIRTFDKSEPFLIFGLNTGFYELKGSDFIFAMIIIDQVKKGGKHNGQ